MRERDGMQLKNKTRILAGGCMVLVCGVVFAIYYYFIHLGFTPNGEELLTTWEAYYHVNYGETMTETNRLWQLVQSLPIKKFGMSFTSIRISQALMYLLIVCGALALSLKDSSKLKNWYILPLFVFLMVVLHTGRSAYYGQLTDRSHQYPLDNHTLPAVFAVWSMWCMDKHAKYHESKVKIIFLLLFIVCVLIGIFDTDLLFCVIFLGPLLVIAAGEWMKRQKHITVGIVKLVSAGLLVIAVMRVVYYTTPFLGSVFQPQSVRYGDWDSHLYGMPNFVNMDKIVEHFLNYISGISGLFNIDISGQPVVSVYLIIYLIRFVLLLIIIWCVGEFILRWWKSEKVFGQETDYVSLTAAVAIIIISAAFVLTSYGDNKDHVRYLMAILPYSTILICRNAQGIMAKLKLDGKRNSVYFALFFLISTFIFAKSPGELRKHPDVWDDAYQEVLEIVEENELGTGVGAFWLAPVLSALSENEQIVQSIAVDQYKFPKEISFVKKLEHVDYDYRYVINGNGWYYLMSEEELEEQLGKPAEIYKTDKFTIYKYDYDISERFIESP